MTNTYTRHKTNNTGLNSLETRMNSNSIERRTARIATRVGQEGAMTRGAFITFIQMTRWQRFKWLLFGFRHQSV